MLKDQRTACHPGGLCWSPALSGKKGNIVGHVGVGDRSAGTEGRFEFVCPTNWKANPKIVSVWWRAHFVIAGLPSLLHVQRFVSRPGEPGMQMIALEIFIENYGSISSGNILWFNTHLRFAGDLFPKRLCSGVGPPDIEPCTVVHSWTWGVYGLRYYLSNAASPELAASH